MHVLRCKGLTIRDNSGANPIEFRNRVLIDGGANSDTLTVGPLASFDPGFPLEQKNIP